MTFSPHDYSNFAQKLSVSTFTLDAWLKQSVSDCTIHNGSAAVILGSASYEPYYLLGLEAIRNWRSWHRLEVTSVAPFRVQIRKRVSNVQAHYLLVGEFPGSDISFHFCHSLRKNADDLIPAKPFQTRNYTERSGEEGKSRGPGSD